MKHIILIALLSAFTAFAQQTQELQQPVVNNELQPGRYSNCDYNEYASYIINDNSIIYQECNTRKYLNADRASFRFPKHTYPGGFALDKNGVYFKGTFIQTDTTGFTGMGGNEGIYWKTATKVFRDTVEITGMDAATFKPLGCGNGEYFTDKDFVYYKGKKIAGSHGPSAYTYHCDKMCYDKNNVYINGEIVYIDGQKLQPVNSSLAKTSTTVYTLNNLKAVPGIDAKTLKKLTDNFYAIDKNHVYYASYNDVKTLPILPKDFANVKAWDWVNSRYVSDGIKLYAGEGYVIADYDAKTFGVVPNSDFTFDKNGIYESRYNSEKGQREYIRFRFKYDIPVTAKNIAKGYGASFVLYGSQAYCPYLDKLYDNVTPAEAALLNKGALTLGRATDSQDKIQIQNGFYTKGGSVYFRDKKVNADAATFTPLGYTFKDKNHVYGYHPTEGIIAVNGIDAATAEPFNGFVRDKNAVYFTNYRLLSVKGVSLLASFPGYRPGCGLDTNPSFNYHLFKNDEGYWLVTTQSPPQIRHLGTTLPEGWNSRISDFKTN